MPLGRSRWVENADTACGRVARAGWEVWRAIALRRKNPRLTRQGHRSDEPAEARIAHRMARPPIVPTVYTDLYPTPGTDYKHAHASFTRTLYSVLKGSRLRCR